MRTSRPVADKLGAVRQDPDLHGLLFILINRATGDRQERAAQLCRHLTTGEGKGLKVYIKPVNARASHFTFQTLVTARHCR
jgi:hypothetical protein